jgi:hypothetical protein
MEINIAHCTVKVSTKAAIPCSRREGDQEDNNNEKERCFRERSCLETTPQTTVFFHKYRYDISLISGEYSVV